MKKRGVIALKNISNNSRKIGKQGTHLIRRKIVKIQMVRMEIRYVSVCLVVRIQFDIYVVPAL